MPVPYNIPLPKNCNNGRVTSITRIYKVVDRVENIVGISPIKLSILVQSQEKIKYTVIHITLEIPLLGLQLSSIKKPPLQYQRWIFPKAYALYARIKLSVFSKSVFSIHISVHNIFPQFQDSLFWRKLEHKKTSMHIKIRKNKGCTVFLRGLVLRAHQQEWC